MTKIYLVRVKGFSKNSNYKVVSNFNVFSNRKKAETYCEYKNLQVKRGESTLCVDYKDIKFEVQEFYINQIDYSKELLKLQIKDLPY